MKVKIDSKEAEVRQPRNWVAVSAHFRSSGAMTDRKKKNNKNAYRGKATQCLFTPT